MKINRNINSKTALVISILLITSFFITFFYFKSHKKITEVSPEPVSSTKIIGAAAVFLEPSDAWIEEMKQEKGEDFYVAADDAMYYNSLAADFLETKNIKIVHTHERHLEFIKNDGQSSLIDRNVINAESWGLIIFDGQKDPLKIDMTDIESAYEKYFN